MNNNLQLVLKSSTTEMSLNDHDAGIYIVPELDGLTGLPEIRTTSGVNAGYDGGWTSAQKFDARSIVIRGVIANEDKTEVERMRRELVALLAQGKNEQLELDFVTETGRAYEVQVRTIACDMAMQRVLTQQEFMITLRADDPLIYDNSSAGEEATVNISGATGGFRIPFEIPLAIDAGSEETVVQNSGLESVAPTVKMYGALHNPKIINHTTNQAMQVEAELGFTEGAWTTPVDAPEGTAVSFEPEREAPIESVKLKGDTYQQTYSGKNLLRPYSGLGTISVSDLTVTLNNDGSLSISGTANAEAYIEFGYQFYGGTSRQNNVLYSLDSASTYRLSATYSGTITGGAYPPRVYVQTKSDFTEVSVALNSSESITGSDGVYRSWIRIRTGTSFTNAIIYPQLELGGAATAWQPYVGGVPAPNPDYPQAVQTVTGENVVKICGKNLYPFSDAAWSSSATTASWCFQDGATGAYGSNITSKTDYKITLPAGTYTAKVYDLSSNIVNIQACADGSPNEVVVTVPSNINSSNLSSTITLTETTTVVVRYRVTDPSLGIGNTKVQIEKGSQATAYEPYQGQSYEINLGKNLFDAANADVKTGYILNNSGVEVSDNTGGYTRNYSVVKPNTTYTISGLVNAGTRRIYYYDGAKNFISRSDGSGASSWQFTTPANCHYVNVQIYTNTDNSTSMASWQIEIGSQATDFAAYFTPIELCKLGNYQDSIYKSGDKWYVHKEIGKVTLNSSNYNSRYGTNQYGLTQFLVNYGVSDYYDTTNYTNMMSDHFIKQMTGFVNTQTQGFLPALDSSVHQLRAYVRILTTTADTADQFKAWLNANTPTFYYTLDPATDTEITNATLVGQLEALVDGNAVVYEGETNIAVTAAGNNMPGIAAIRYYTDKEPDQRDELIIDSRLKTITLNGLDVYHLKTEGSEFPMLAPGENKLSLQSDIVGDNGYAKVSYKQGYLSI